MRTPEPDLPSERAATERERVLSMIEPQYESWLSRHPCSESTQWHVQNFIIELRHAIGAPNANA